MRTLVRMPSELPERSGQAGDEWARIDPSVYLTKARDAQAEAVAEALHSGWRAVRRGLDRLAALWRRLKERRAERIARREAIAQLRRLDDRLLGDIGLRRDEIELAVSGLLADPRVRRRTPAGPASATEPAAPMGAHPTASTNANRPATQQDRISDLAA